MKADTKIDKKKDGSRYSKMIKKGGFDIIAFLHQAIEEKSFWIILRLLLRTLWLGWSIPFGFILKKLDISNKKGKTKGFNFKNFGFHQMKSWGEGMIKIVRADIKVYFEQPLLPDKTYLFASNHTSPFDIAILSATIPYPSAYIANKEFTSFFVTNYWVKSLGGVMVDKKSRTGLVKAYKDILSALNRGNSLIIFPESVMSPDGLIKKFQKGGLSAAVSANALIVPIYIYGASGVIKPGDMHINRNVDIEVYFCKPIDPSLLSEDDKGKIEQIVYDRLLEKEKKILQYDSTTV
jgi:1-acyl-sn-glycerol-3-phosphate acyltransferase